MFTITNTFFVANMNRMSVLPKIFSTNIFHLPTFKRVVWENLLDGAVPEVWKIAKNYEKSAKMPVSITKLLHTLLFQP